MPNFFVFFSWETFLWKMYPCDLSQKSWSYLLKGGPLGCSLNPIMLLINLISCETLTFFPFTMKQVSCWNSISKENIRTFCYLLLSIWFKWFSNHILFWFNYFITNYNYKLLKREKSERLAACCFLPCLLSTLNVTA